jgi:hypothetical protein
VTGVRNRAPRVACRPMRTTGGARVAGRYPRIRERHPTLKIAAPKMHTDVTPARITVIVKARSLMLFASSGRRRATCDYSARPTWLKITATITDALILRRQLALEPTVHHLVGPHRVRTIAIEALTEVSKAEGMRCCALIGPSGPQLSSARRPQSCRGVLTKSDTIVLRKVA